MEKLNQFLDTILPEKEPKKDDKNQCCKDKDNRIYNDDYGWNVCSSCGTVIDMIKEVNDFRCNMSSIIKTFIPMSYKFNKLVRLHKWSNYSYYEVRDNKLMKFIDELPIRNKEIKNFSKIIFLEEFKKVRTRAKVKMGLVAYSIYKSHIIFKEEIDIDELFDLLDINFRHYNSANKKLESDKLLYPLNINKYLKMIDNKLNKNELIRIYNDMLEKYDKYNSKTFLISIMYYMLNKQENFDKKEFLEKFKISENSINGVLDYIKVNQ